MLKPGDNVDSWCGKCKFVLAHTIEAMADDKPARVNCNTCKAQHGYKPVAPGAGSRSQKTEAGSPRPGRSRASRYETLLKGKDAAAKSYSPKDKYELGDIMAHPSFGLGVATAIKDHTKIEVLFDDGPRVLVHGR
jgi:hypothetical protein